MSEPRLSLSVNVHFSEGSASFERYNGSRWIAIDANQGTRVCLFSDSLAATVQLISELTRLAAIQRAEGTGAR